MSELKAYIAPTADGTGLADYYLKSEADKVIAEKDKEIRHQKYKRCLDKAKWYKDKVDAIQNGYIRSNIESQNGVMTTCPPECNPKFSFYFKWHKRWLELAEQFKPNSTAPEENSDG